MTRAIIKSIPENGDNHFTIRIPLFEDNTNQEALYTAVLCHQPGIIGGYAPGDCVFVGFEDSQLIVPVILGKLYLGEMDHTINSIEVNNLLVTNKAVLTSNSEFGGYTANDIYNLQLNISDIRNKIKGE